MRTRSGDADTIAEVVNEDADFNGDGTVTSRDGQSLKTLAKIEADLEGATAAATADAEAAKTAAETAQTNAQTSAFNAAARAREAQASATAAAASAASIGDREIASDDTLTGDGTTASELSVANPVPDGGAAGQFLQRTSVGYVWATAPSGGGTGGGGGLASVASDDTLTGSGIPADPLGVANAFTAADERKLDGIESGATADQTPAEIVTGLQNLSGSARLDASAVKNLPRGGGLSEVASDDTLSGDGTTNSKLAVARPVPEGGTAGQLLSRTASGYEWADRPTGGGSSTGGDLIESNEFSWGSATDTGTWLNTGISLDPDDVDNTDLYAVVLWSAATVGNIASAVFTGRQWKAFNNYSSANSPGNSLILEMHFQSTSDLHVASSQLFRIARTSAGSIRILGGWIRSRVPSSELRLAIQKLGGGSASGGMEAVQTDATLGGAGTTASPLGVVNPVHRRGRDETRRHRGQRHRRSDTGRDRHGLAKP